jgi:hypothetical protein
MAMAEGSGSAVIRAGWRVLRLRPAQSARRPPLRMTDFLQGKKFDDRSSLGEIFDDRFSLVHKV